MLARLGRIALATAMPRGARGRLSILGYHRVLQAPDPLRPNDPGAAEFEQTMGWVRRSFNVIPLDDGLAALRRGTLPSRALAITFDDGYADNETVAAPILERLELPATFFIATGYLDGGRMFNDTVVEAVRAARGETLDLTPLGLACYPVASIADRRRAIEALLSGIKYRPVHERAAVADRIAGHVGAPSNGSPMMTSAQAEGLARRGFALGGHTVNHPILARLSSEEALREIAQGRARVGELAGRAPRVFAYPNGGPGRDYTATTVRLVREAGFDAAVTSSPGAARRDTDPFQLPRFTPWDNAPLPFMARMWNNAVRVEPRLLPVESMTTSGTQ